VDDLLSSVSGPRSNILIFWAVAGGINAFNSIMNNIALMEMVPRFKCTSNDITYDCVEADFCGANNIKFQVDLESPYTLRNWSEQIGLICRPGWQVGLIGSVYFGGWCSTLLWLPGMSEWIGRKRMFVWSLVSYTVLWAIIMFTHSFKVFVVCFFLLGFL
jgi:MFS family permease